MDFCKNDFVSVQKWVNYQLWAVCLDCKGCILMTEHVSKICSLYMVQEMFEQEEQGYLCVLLTPFMADMAAK